MLPQDIKIKPTSLVVIDFEKKIEERVAPGTKPGQFFDNLNVDLLTLEEAANILCKSPQTIRNWIAKRQFPFVKVGNKHMVLRGSLDQWLKRKEFKPWV